MKKFIFYVFSGTGNTAKVCGEFANSLSEHSVNSEIFPIEKGLAPLQADSADTLVLAYPVHAFNAPEPVLEFAGNLPAAYGKKVYIVKTSGEPLRLNNGSSVKLCRILERKGYTVAGEFHYVMPYNILFRHSDGMAYRMWETALRRIPRDAAQAAEGIVSPVVYRLSERAVAGIMRFEQPAMHFNGRLFRVRKDKCVDCGKCVRECPIRNISLKDGALSFGGKCVGCMRCAFGCPKAAIDIGLLNRAKVNGRYDFANDAADRSIPRYCNKAYARYFGENSEN